jgi:hypothetical protein
MHGHQLMSRGPGRIERRIIELFTVRGLETEADYVALWNAIEASTTSDEDLRTS